MEIYTVHFTNRAIEFLIWIVETFQSIPARFFHQGGSKAYMPKKLGKDLPKMIMFCDWLSETKTIIVHDSFFRKTISI
jgi:hypothetical protein